MAVSWSGVVVDSLSASPYAGLVRPGLSGSWCHMEESGVPMSVRGGKALRGLRAGDGRGRRIQRGLSAAFTGEVTTVGKSDNPTFSPAGMLRGNLDRVRRHYADTTGMAGDDRVAHHWRTRRLFGYEPLHDFAATFRDAR